MAKFIFTDAVCGDNRSYSLPYYNWLCLELVNAHKLFLRDYHERSGLQSKDLKPTHMALEALRQETYDDFTPKHEDEFLAALDAMRDDFRSEKFTQYFVGKASSRVKFDAYVEDLIRRIRLDSEKANWLSNLVQRHFFAFAVRPMTHFSISSISYKNSDRRSPVQEVMFHSLAELRDRAFRDPSVERVERYLKKVELLRATAPYKRLHHFSNEVTDGSLTLEIQEIEDELTVALLWKEHAVEH
jgi:hypothetical protein